MISFKKIFLWIMFFTNSLAIGNDRLFTIIDDPLTKKNNVEIIISGNYQTKTKHSKNSNLTAKTALTFYSSNSAYSFWSNATNNLLNNKRLSEIYQFGARIRYNLTKFDYLFTQSSWLTDKHNDLDSKNYFIIGYGKQIFNNPLHSLKMEVGPYLRYKNFINNRHEIVEFNYIGGNYELKISNNIKLKQNISFFTLLNKNHFTISETILQIMIKKYFLLNIINKINCNKNYLPPVLKQININTSIQIIYTL